MAEKNLDIKWIPSYPSIRPKECPSGFPRHSVNQTNLDICGLSRLMQDIGASPSRGGLMSGWTSESFTGAELVEYGFKVIERSGEVPQARCLKCGLEMSLRRENQQETR